jgi:hypothetical protein
MITVMVIAEAAPLIVVAGVGREVCGVGKIAGGRKGRSNLG